MTMLQGTMVEATQIGAPSSTKNTDDRRNPETYQTKKGNQWYQGMKIHAAVGTDMALIHSLSTTAANVEDLTPADELLNGRTRSPPPTLDTRESLNGRRRLASQQRFECPCVPAGAEHYPIGPAGRCRIC
jgi:IS5 family transposase